jgi:hypothetical protein
MLSTTRKPLIGKSERKSEWTQEGLWCWKLNWICASSSASADVETRETRPLASLARDKLGTIVDDADAADDCQLLSRQTAQFLTFPLLPPTSSSDAVFGDWEDEGKIGSSKGPHAWLKFKLIKIVFYMPSLHDRPLTFDFEHCKMKLWRFPRTTSQESTNSWQKTKSLRHFYCTRVGKKEGNKEGSSPVLVV